MSTPIRRPLTVPERDRRSRVRHEGRWEATWIGALCFVAFILIAPLTSFAIGSLADDGVYAVLGRALADGLGYHAIHLVGAPAFTAYPPGVPLLFAGVWRLVDSLDQFQLVVSALNAAAYGITVGLLWLLARERLLVGRLVTLCFVLVPFFLDATLHYFSLTLSEPWFALGWAALLVLYSSARNATGRTAGFMPAFGLGLLAMVMVAIRFQAVVMLPAILIALLIERSDRGAVQRGPIGGRAPVWRVPKSEVSGPADAETAAIERRRHRRSQAVRLAAVCLGALAPFAGWLILRTTGADEGGGALAAIAGLPHVAWLPSGSVGAVFEGGVRTVLTNYYLYHSQLAYHTGITPLLGQALAFTLALVAAASAIIMLRSQPAIALTGLATAATVLFWPFNDFRLLVALLPFAGLVAAPGLQLLLNSLPRRAGQLAGVALALIAASVVARQAELRYYGLAAVASDTPPSTFTTGYALARNSAHILQTSDWVAHNTTAREPVMAALTAGVFLRTDRPMIETNPPAGLITTFGPRPFAVPGRYLASAILAGDAAVLVLEHGRLRILEDVAVVQRECPDLLMRRNAGPADSYPAYYRIAADRSCLHRLTADPDATRDAEPVAAAGTPAAPR